MLARQIGCDAPPSLTLEGEKRAMDGQLAAMRTLAQKQFRPKSDSVPPGQLALDLLGFMLAQRQQQSGGSAELAEPVLPKAPPREKRTGKLHLVPWSRCARSCPRQSACASTATS